MISKTASPARDLPADLPRLHVLAGDGDVLADRAGLELEAVEVLARDEEHLAHRRIRVSAALEPVSRHGAHALVRGRDAALAGGRGEETGDRLADLPKHTPTDPR